MAKSLISRFFSRNADDRTSPAEPQAAVAPTPVAPRPEIRSEHISQQFNQDLEELRSQLLAMGGLVETQLQDALQALVQGDTELALRVKKREAEVNEYDLRIDDDCTRLIARRQPTASDLRMVVSVYKCASDLERMGDEAKRLAKLTLKLAEDGQAPVGYTEIRAIGQRVLGMVRDILDAFARQDLDAAFDVAEQDRQVDKAYKAANKQIIATMQASPEAIPSLLHMLWAVRALERIGDHAHNIAQSLAFLVKGKDVRHAGLESFRTLVGRPRDEDD
ncbi:phosphate signaling complex protein PhoU [Pokkaliibacter sp. CJK22405]|uniref:phosphate signaling complex protein PhoU n=1 Tax=Pokkaliibacter sp. CJK22405 TaxID=3384615 RepID=UPI003984E8B6